MSLVMSHITADPWLVLQADLIYMPFMERFTIAMPTFAGYDLPTGAVKRWCEAMQQRDSVQVAAADPQKLLAAYRCVSQFAVTAHVSQ